MSLSNLAVYAQYVSNGVLTGYSIPSALIESDTEEVKVFTRDESTDPATVATLVAGLDYDLTGRPDPSSFHTTVTFRSGRVPASGVIIQVERELALVQPLDGLNANSQIYLPDHETAYDRAIALIQQLDFRLKRALLFNRTAGILNLELPDPVPNAVIGYNADGDALINLSATELLAIEGSLAISNNLSDLSNVTQALINLGIAPLTVQNKVAFTDGQSATNVTGETVDGSIYTSVVYEYETIRGTTVVSTGRFSLQYKNSTWGVVDGGYEGDAHGLSWSISQVGSVAQLRIAASSSGGGDGTIKLKKHYFKV